MGIYNQCYETIDKRIQNHLYHLPQTHSYTIAALTLYAKNVDATSFQLRYPQLVHLHIAHIDNSNILSQTFSQYKTYEF